MPIAPSSLSENDPRISDVFRNHDMARMHRPLFKQFCYLLNAGCTYTGCDVKAAHRYLAVMSRTKQLLRKQPPDQYGLQYAPHTV